MPELPTFDLSVLYAVAGRVLAVVALFISIEVGKRLMYRA